MAGEFKIKTGLLLGPSPTQPVTSIQDTSTSIASDASSLLVTGKAIHDFLTAETSSFSTDISNLESSVGSLDGLIQTNISDISNLESSVGGLDTLTQNLDSSITSLDGLIQTNISDISAIESYQIIQDSSIDANWQRWVDSNRTGFLNQTDTSLSFNDSTYVFTLGDEGAGWAYYRDGIKYEISGDSSIRLTTSGTPPADTYYITIDSTNGSLSVSTTPWSLDGIELLVAYVDFNDSNIPKYVIGEERHSMLIDRRIHKYLHETRGSQYISGGGLTGPDVAVGDVTVTDASNAVGIGNTEIADEDIFQTLPELIRPNGDSSIYFAFLRSSGNLSDWTLQRLPFPEAGGNIQYDDGVGMTVAADGKFVNSYIMFTNLSGPTGNPQFAILPGQSEFDDVNSAIDENPASFDFAGLSIAEYVIAWQLTWEVSTGYSTTGSVALASSPKRIQVNATTATSVTTESHNDLIGLQGGNSTERYHLSLSQYNDYVGKSYIDASLNTKQNNITFGTQNQVPKTNSATNDFEYGLLFFNDKSISAVDSSFNLFINKSLRSNNAGFLNVGLGNSAGSKLNTGDSNIFIGGIAGSELLKGEGNTIIGSSAGADLVSGNSNIIIGYFSGVDLLDASNNVMIGNRAGKEETGSFKLYIHSIPSGTADSSSSLIYGEFDGTRKLRINAQYIEFNGIPEASTSHILYYNPNTNRITYAESSTAGGGPDWGDIDGDITNQTDLWTILNDLSTNKISNFGNQILDGSLNIKGNLVVDGSATIINTTNLDVSDNIIYINTGMSGTPPSTMVSGMKVDRGSEDPYFFIFAEDTDTFRVGTESDEGSLPGDTQAIATREDSPIDNAITYWNNTENRFDTSTSLLFNGDLIIENDVSVNTDLRVGVNIYAPGLSEVSTGQILYYNTSSGLITYADSSVSGGGDSYWTLDGSTLVPIDSTVDVQLGVIQIATDAGVVTVIDMDVSSAITGTEESYSFNMDGSIVAKIYGNAQTGGTLNEIGFVVETAQYMGDPRTDGSWRFYPDSNGDLVFEKRVSGTWSEKGKFTG